MIHFVRDEKNNIKKSTKKKKWTSIQEPYIVFINEEYFHFAWKIIKKNHVVTRFFLDYEFKE